MKTQTKLAVGLIAAALATLAVFVGLAAQAEESGPVEQVEQADPAAGVGQAGSEQETLLVREDSHVLGEPGTSGVEFVEFLDFECEACRAAYPIVEELRAEYAGEVTFVARYFPLPGHLNSERAARAVESASRQGQFEAMYQRMYETQATWGEGREPLDDLFRSFADDLGLDLAQYDADYASPEVAARVQRDLDDGTELGIQGTPTFYLDGQLFQPRTVGDFATAIDAALAE